MLYTLYMKESFSHSHFDKIVGLPEESKGHEDELQQYVDMLIENGSRFIKKFELEKTPRDIEIIDYVLEQVSAELEQLERNKEIPIEHESIHILKEGGTEEYTEGKLINGANSTRLHSILVDRPKSDIEFALIIFHELLHMKSYKALQYIAEEGEKGTLETYRSGFSVRSRDGKESHFDSAEEAVVGYLTRDFYNNHLKESVLFEEEFAEAEELGIEHNTSRTKEVAMFEKIADDLWEQNQDKFESKDEIVSLFLNAHVNGKLLAVGRLIESTHGKGSFRELGKGVNVLEKGE